MKIILTILLLTSLSCTAQTGVTNMDELRTMRVVKGKIVRDKPVKKDTAVKIIATKPKTIKKQ